MTRTKLGLAMIVLGLLLIAAALLLAGYNIYSDKQADQASREALRRLEELTNVTPSASTGELEPSSSEASLPENDHTAETIISDELEIPDYILDPNMKMPTETIDGIEYIGVLRIPALELELPIIDSWDYEKLKTAPCRYTGSAYKNDLVICGHDYRSHFGKLKSISIGDYASFTDIDGNTFSYKAASVEILPKTAIADMVTSDWPLTLFTCTTDGQSRMAIRFEVSQ